MTSPAARGPQMIEEQAMGEYEPEDSRNVTLTNKTAPGEPPRTGPREDAARAEAGKKRGEADDDQRTGSQSQGQGQQSQNVAG